MSQDGQERWLRLPAGNPRLRFRVQSSQRWRFRQFGFIGDNEQETLHQRIFRGAPPGSSH